MQITCFTSYPLLRFDLSRVEIVSKERNDKIIEKGLMCQNIGPFSFIFLQNEYNLLRNIHLAGYTYFHFPLDGILLEML